jgi:hypothetical protein
MPLPTADFEGLLRAFAQREIRFVVIGGVSAALQGVPAVTYDLDLVLDHEPANLDRAFEVLQNLDAVFREHLPKRIEPQRSDLESNGSMLMMTRLGPLDLLGEVATGWRYDELLQRSRKLNITASIEIHILDLSGLIEIKERVGREKDLAVLPLYRQTMSEREKTGEGSD